MVRRKDAFDQQLAQMREFVEAELLPLEAEFLSNSHALETTLNAKRAKVRELGLWAPNLPKSLGGMGIDLVQLGRVSEVLGRSPLGHYSFGCQAPDAGNAELLHLYGNDEQKTKYLTPLAAGDIRSCFGMTEPHTAGSNPTLLQTRAERIDGGWRIKGHKWFTSSPMAPPSASSWRSPIRMPSRISAPACFWWTPPIRAGALCATSR